MGVALLMVAIAGAESGVVTQSTSSRAESASRVTACLVYTKDGTIKSATFDAISRAVLDRLDLQDLERLSLADTDVNDEQLTEMPFMRNLRDLNLEATNVAGHGLQFLLREQEGVPPRLEYLTLIGDSVDDGGLAVVSRFANLKWLLVGGPGVTDRGVKHLAQLKGLRTLHLIAPNVSAEAWEQLTSSLPLHPQAHLSRQRGSTNPFGRPWGEPQKSEDPFGERAESMDSPDSQVQGLEGLDTQRQPRTDRP